MLLATDFAVLDHVDGSVWLIANAVNYDGTDERVDDAYEDALKRLDAMQVSLNAPQSQVGSAFNTEAKPQFTNRTTSKDYQSSVKRAIEYVEVGDAFQIVLSQRFDTKTSKRTRYLPSLKNHKSQSLYVLLKYSNNRFNCHRI